jgi:hypothetical protein
MQLRQISSHCSILAIIVLVLAFLPVFAVCAGGGESFDTSTLVEVRELDQLPEGIQVLVGRRKAGRNEIVDVGEPFNSIDVLDGRPSRRFILAAVSGTSAVVAYEQGGIAIFYVVRAFVNTRLGWVEKSRWSVTRRPETLGELVKSVPGHIK